MNEENERLKQSAIAKINLCPGIPRDRLAVSLGMLERVNSGTKRGNVLNPKLRRIVDELREDGIIEWRYPEAKVTESPLYFPAGWTKLPGIKRRIEPKDAGCKCYTVPLTELYKYTSSGEPAPTTLAAKRARLKNG